MLDIRPLFIDGVRLEVAHAHLRNCDSEVIEVSICLASATLRHGSTSHEHSHDLSEIEPCLYRLFALIK